MTTALESIGIKEQQLATNQVEAAHENAQRPDNFLCHGMMNG
jgi:hypothetical protein